MNVLYKCPFFGDWKIVTFKFYNQRIQNYL